jgi:tetratricopeptide (TPR) repeat protein
LINAGRAALQQDDFTEAERHFEQALETAEKFSPGDPRLGRSLNNLAAVYYKQQAYDRAEPLMRRSLSVLEEALGPSNADVAQTKKNLAAIYYLQGNYDEAEPLLKQSLATLEELHGPNHAFVATVLNNLAALYQAEDRYVDAEPLLARSLEIWEGLLGKDHPDVVKSRDLLARLRAANGLTPGGANVAQADGQGAGGVPPAAADEPGTADQILSLAAEAEAAAIVDGVGDAAPAAGPGLGLDNAENQGSADAEQAAKALANLSASESAAARAADEIAAPDAAILPGQPHFAVYLSTLWSKEEAGRYWQALKQEIPDVLAGKQMEIEEVATAAGGGSFYRVLTAPYASDPDAQEACNQIRSEVRTHDCSVVAR